MTSTTGENRRPFDFSKYPKRRIAIMFLYLGWDFDGLVRQENTLNTVEQTLFDALIRTRLIESADNCEWTRCGRTDKGVSEMKNACQRLIGSHDFRNFCHIDKNTGRLEMSYIRTINVATIEELENNFSDESCSSRKFNLLKLTIKASGFLWHQIRCIVTILYEISCGNEKAELIDQLLDVELFPSRPQYKLANELPLCLFDCTFAEGQLVWHFDGGTICSIIETLQKMWAEHQVK
uniref:tRNA pseudouridine synthase n=1 Tax=Meloidogyne hapla TaxID=6305 RepID=A0A1I8AYJ0_MELHA